MGSTHNAADFSGDNIGGSQVGVNTGTVNNYLGRGPGMFCTRTFEMTRAVVWRYWFVLLHY
jgi:hypothetical protein